MRILRPETKSQKGPQNIDKICVISCVQYVVWKMGPWPLYLFKSYQNRSSYILLWLYRIFICWNEVKFFIFSGNLLLRESPFNLVNCLKSFDFKLCFVYALVVVGFLGTFILTNIWITSEFIKCDCRS